VSFAPKTRVQRAAGAAAVALALLGATGCGAINEQATTKQYAASDGIVRNVGDVKLRNLLIVAADEAEPGRIIGTAVNTSSSPVELSFEAEGGTAQVTIPANSEYRFDDVAEDEVEGEAVLAQAGAMPGALAPVTVTAASDSEELQIPVVDGTLPEYAQYVPGGWVAPAAESSESAGTGEEAHGEEAHGTEAPAEEAHGTEAPAEESHEEAASSGH